MDSVNKKLASHGSIYLLGNIIRRAVSLVMLPIYTRFLTPADYGIIELLSMVIDFAGIILGLRIGQAIFRFYHEYDNINDRNEVISTSLYLISILNILGILLIVAFVRPISYAVFGNYTSVKYLLLFSVTLLFQSMIEIPMLFLRAQQRPWLFVTFSSVKLILQLSLNIYFIVIKNMHVEGVIYSALISGAIMSATLTIYTLSITGLKWSSKKAKELSSFSIPLVLTSIVAFYITFGDRYFLRIYHGLTEVGIYSLGYKFGFLLSFLVTAPFFNIWDSEKYNIYKKHNAREIYQKTFLLLSSAVIFVAVGISVFVKDVLRIMSDQSFWSAYQVVPIILSAYFIDTLMPFTNLGILIKKKTIEITYGTLIGATVVTLGYILLIPHYGAIGAAWSTALAFSARCIWISWRSKRLYDMKLPWGKLVLLATMGLIAYICSMFSPDKLLVSFGFNLFILILFGLIFLILPILPPDIRHSIKGFVLKPWNLQRLIKGAARPN